MSDTTLLYTALIVGAVVLLIALVINWLKVNTEKSRDTKETELKVEEKEKEKSGSHSQELNKSKAPKKWKPAAGKKWTLPSHPLIAADFKGHTESVLSLDFDSSGKYLASASEGAL